MESEAKNQIMYCDAFFYATMCHVCKRFGDGVQLKRCSCCKMIAYCGKEHQRQHWQQHKPMCKATRDVHLEFGKNLSRATTEEWVYEKLAIARIVSSRLKRRLIVDEMQMLCFQRVCLVCYELKSKLLETCQKCAASFCQNHKYSTEHRNICAQLELCLRIDFFSIKEGTNPPDLQPYLQHFVQEYSHVSCKNIFRNMKDFIKVFRNIRTDSEMSSNLPANLNSEYLTPPLTLFHAMQLLNYVPKGNDLVVHILGARKSEEITLIGWEIFPRLIGAKVSIILIGPELPCQSTLSHHCDNCMSREKKCLTFELHDGLYEDYVRSSSFVKPDLVIGFNMGVRNHEPPVESSKKTWTPSIELIAKENCPFILTSSTLYSFKKETDIIKTILDKEVNHIYSGKNPFASLIPYRAIGGLEYVSYMNQYIIIYRSLFITDMRNLSDRYKLMSVFDDEENIAR
ncbi:uncharacterized protein LOC112460459 [Temnothorax curvispinosus]|uniref:Uncharacterized protein LOC112460459 n=1 Tax=Temnothorax curvispinosus TaxID=300111 RepID=A0A6J1QGG0_9HYME|nr:uncharacterized protein LOC112460459 [Temnothorax curvispinosus]